MRILIGGSTGLVGTALVTSLKEKGAAVSRLVRSTPTPKTGDVEWHPNRGSIDTTGLDGFDGVVNLAGESIAEGRWTEGKKRRIRDSRVKGTRLLSESLAALSKRPKAFLCASATGFYGSREAALLDEDSPSGRGFLAEVCREWEKATEPAAQAGVRVVNLRFGPILTLEGGMLQKMLPPFKLGLGGKVGSGRQYISWVAMDDVIGAINFALENDALRGPVNVVAPNPSTNAEFTKTLGRLISRPTAFAMPAVAARLAFGEMADEMLLASQRVAPKRLKEAGYQFQYSELESALRHVLEQ
jgi:uncharacterized protein (TIGR01777 family)